MAKAHYEIVEHDGGWAYRMQGSFSETFPPKPRRRPQRTAPQPSRKSRAKLEDIEFEDAKANGISSAQPAMTGRTQMSPSR